MVGRTLQHYRIVRTLGHGGMGEVFAAEDLHLHRLVALKILPPDMALDPERLHRFQREAEAVASLNHPNVVTIYGVEEADGLHFLTMELVEGETLADAIRPGGLSLERFLAIAVPLADAVSAAHERGIVHRDLKPANVMIAASGRVKVLDFGLAKLKREAAGRPEAETVTAEELTAPHHVLGTAAYMSPEQAEGRPVDVRSDIFSLGVVLYEMATGTRPFRGESAISVLSAILKDTPPPPIEVNPAVPYDLDRVIRRCLAKDPARRYQSATDLRNDLEELQPQASHEGKRGARWRMGFRQWRVMAAAIGGAAVLAAGSAVVWRNRNVAPPGAGPPRVEVAQLTTQSGVEWFPNLSPDGKWLLYAGDAGAYRHIYLQSVSGKNPIDLSGESTADDDQPVFSPDGERIAFRSSREGGGIFVMGRTGEAVRRVTRTGFRPTWSPDGASLAFATANVELHPQNSEGRSGIWTVDVATGQTHSLLEGDAVLPSWSPNGRRIAFTRISDGPGVWTIAASGGAPTPVVVSDSGRNWSPVWSPDGRYLYFVSDRAGSMNLWRVAIDEITGETRGEPEPVTTPAPYLVHPSVSGEGSRIVYSAALVTTNVQRLSLDPVGGAPQGEPSWVTTGSRRWANPAPSPDGAWVVFYSLVQPEGDLYIQRPDGGPPRQLTSDAAKDRLPRWSPDGQWVSAFSDRSGSYELWKIRPDGSELTQMTGEGGSYHAWSPDGSLVAVSSPGLTWLFDPTRPWTDQTPEALPPLALKTTRFRVNSWSPDGARLVGDVEAGGKSVGIATYSLRSRTYEQLTDFGEWPVWLPDSRRVLFVSGGNAFYMVDSRSKEVRKIFSVTRDVIGPPQLARDGTTAYYTRRATEADIWLLTMKE